MTSSKLPDCASCPLRDQETGTYDPDRRIFVRNPGGRPTLNIIADQPRPGARQNELPRELENSLRQSRIPRSRVYFDYAIACWSTTASAADESRAAQCCAPRLDIPDGPTLAMGQHGLYARRGHREFNKWRGASVKGTWVTDSPLAIFAKPALSEALGAHLNHALLPPRPWPKEIIIRDGPAMQEALRRLAHSSHVAVDIETAGADPLRDPILCIGLSDGETVAVVPWRVKGHDSEEIYACDETQNLLRDALRAPSTKVAHNGAHDFLGLAAIGMDVNGARFDTLLAHAAVAPELPHSLQYVAGFEFPIEAWKGGFVTSADPDLKGAEVYSKRDQYELRTYCGKDATATAWLAYNLRSRLARIPSGDLHYKRLTLVADICMKMQSHGMPLDEERRRVLHEDMQTSAEEHRAEFTRISGVENTGSEGTTAAVKEYFFQTLRAPVLAVTATQQPSLSKDVLKRYANDPLNPTLSGAAKALLKFKQYAKIASTFTGPECITVHDGRCHPSWRSWGTITRRLSCAGPNLMQMPLVARKMFVAPEGYVFVEADISQLEPRITADLSGEPRLLEVYRNGLDLYKQVGSAVFNIRYDQVSDSQRQIAKMVWLACLAEGTPIRVQGKGWVPIEAIERDDLVWDGEEWVSHEGVIDKGERDVIPYGGGALTPDHKVLNEDGEWQPAEECTTPQLPRPPDLSWAEIWRMGGFIIRREAREWLSKAVRQVSRMRAGVMEKLR